MLKRSNNNPGTKKTPARLTPEQIHEMIKAKAYQIYKSRGSSPGDSTSDWAQAEKLVKRELRV